MAIGTQSRRSFLAAAGAAAAAACVPLGVAVAAPGAEARHDVWTSVELVGADGQAITLGQVAAPVVIVHLWASWCSACLGELPSLESFAARTNPADVALMLVSHPKHWDADQAFLRRNGVHLPAYTLAPDTSWEIREAAFDMTGGSFALPQTLVFAGRDRRCVMAREGAENWRSSQVAARLGPWLRPG